MVEENDNQWKEIAKNISKKMYYGIAIVLIISGFALSLFASQYPNEIIWKILEEIGIFVSAVIAVSLIHEKVVKDIEHRSFVEDLTEVFNDKLADYSVKCNLPAIHEEGRLEITKKVVHLKRAKKEYLEVGVTLHSLSGYFYSISPAIFKEHVINQLKNGVDFKLILLDPDSSSAKIYEEDRGEEDLRRNICSAIDKFKKIKAEIVEANYKGTFNVYTYSHLPEYSIQFIDPSMDNGRALISHYMYGIRRSKSPVIEISKVSDRVMFDTYYESVQCTLKNCKQII